MERKSQPPPPFAWGLVLALTGLKFLVHLLTSNAYGYFRDELYFLDCARHLQWGYVDDAPGIVILSRLALLLGGSLPVVRLLAALGGAATVFLAALLARELGGKRYAQALAALCVLSAPVFLGMGSILCVGAFESLTWVGCLFLAVRIVRTGNARLWLGFGVVAGLGLQIKYTFGLFLACFLGAMLLTPLRRAIRSRWFWAGAAAAALIFLPALLWQVRNHFPLLEDLENIRRTGKNVILGPLAFVRQQILIQNVLLLPLWLSGLVWTFRRREFRFLGWCFTFLFGAMYLLHAKDYYLAAIYPMVFAAGAVAVEGFLERHAGGRIWPRDGIAGLVAASFVVLAPLLLPVLAPARLLAYQAWLGVRPQKTEVTHDSPLEQRFSDQFGWKELAEETARIYHALPAEERARTAIYAGNYGEAGAINLFGPALGLPTAICAHQACSYWGLPAEEPRTVICLGCDAGLSRVFEEVTVAAVHHHPWGMPEENRPIYLCRGPRSSFRALWPEITHWN
jgi:MFS family permease